jgi:exodeoxyribonuclease VII large subunit
VQGGRAAPALATALADLSREADVDVIVLARGGGSFEDLLPFSDERLVRAVADCPVPVVSAVGHEQDTPLCDLAADARASTPTAAARLVVPDEGEVRRQITDLRNRLERAPLVLVERKRAALDSLAGRLRTLSHQSTLNRGYAIVRTDNGIARDSADLTAGERIEVELAQGGFGARVEETRP